MARTDTYENKTARLRHTFTVNLTGMKQQRPDPLTLSLFAE